MKVNRCMTGADCCCAAVIPYYCILVPCRSLCFRRMHLSSHGLCPIVRARGCRASRYGRERSKIVLTGRSSVFSRGAAMASAGKDKGKIVCCVLFLYGRMVYAGLRFCGLVLLRRHAPQKMPISTGTLTSSAIPCVTASGTTSLPSASRTIEGRHTSIELIPATDMGA